MVVVVMDLMPDLMISAVAQRHFRIGILSLWVLLLWVLQQQLLAGGAPDPSSSTRSTSFFFAAAVDKEDEDEEKVPQFACDFGRNPRLRTFAFCDRNLSDDVRVKDLVSRLTLDEKITQLVNSAASVPSLGLPSYQWWNEALHGVARSRGVDFTDSELSLHAATSFPVPLLTSASFNSCLWQLIGQARSCC